MCSLVDDVSCAEHEEVEVDGFIFKRKRRRTQQESREEVLHESEDTQQSQVPHPQPGQGDEGHLIRSCATPADRAALQVKAMGLLSTFEGVSDPQQVLPEFCKKLAQVIPRNPIQTSNSKRGPLEGF